MGLNEFSKIVTMDEIDDDKQRQQSDSRHLTSISSPTFVDMSTLSCRK